MVPQFIVKEHDKHTSASLFWAKFSNPDSGTQFGFQKILTILKHERAERDTQDAANAIQCFSRNLGHTDTNGAFSYVSKTGTVVITKMGDIAKNWCKFLAHDALIAAWWSAQQAEQSAS